MTRLQDSLPLTCLILAVVGCNTARPAGPLPNDCGRTPDEVLACVRARENGVRSLRARFNATTRRGGESHASTGVLLVDKPQRFRLRLMLPLGLTIFDYVRDGDRVQMSLPLQGDTNAKADDPLFADVDLAETFLRGPFAFPGSCTATADVAVQCRAVDGTLLRTFAIDPRSATITEETSWTEDGTARLVLRYSDHALVEGVVLPRHISLAYPQRGIALDIDVERYEVNPVLAADLFRPPSP